VLAPAIVTEPQPTPESASTPASSSSPPEAAPANAPQGDQHKPKPKPRKPAPRKPTPVVQQPAVVEAPKPEPAKPAAPDSGAQITADVPQAAVQSQRQNTVNLLWNSEGKLNHIGHALNDGEQGMLRQARNYIAQSNQALQAGDIERAYNLAVKAGLLANELAK
jgi:outer membrane biosynthesis protein TonB